MSSERSTRDVGCLPPGRPGGLDRAVAYYERQRSGLGVDLLAEIEKASQRILQDPTTFPVHQNTSFRRCSLSRFPYSIFFLTQENGIWIAAVAHHKRKPNYWSRRRMTEEA